MNPLILAFDFGGTRLSAALTRLEDREWLAHERVFSPPAADARSTLGILLGLGRKLLAGQRPDAIGVSFGGPVDPEIGLVRLSHQVPGWEDIPLAGLLRAEFSTPVCIDNDANAAALGEHRLGAGQGFDHLLFLTISTGVGGGWILNGKLWRGTEGLAGEIGHTIVDPQGPLCTCGKQGCVESFASGPSLAQNALRLLVAQPGRGEILRGLLAGDSHSATGQIISQAAAAGDDLAWEVLEKGAWAVGVGIGNAANLINPQRFILGGGVTKAGDRFWQVVRRVASETALPAVHFDIVPAALGDDAQLWGAVILAKEFSSH